MAAPRPPAGAARDTRSPRGRRALIGAALGIGLLPSLLWFAGAGRAAVTGACRVPEVLLTFDSDLKRMERLVDRSQPVRIVLIGPHPDHQAISGKKRTRLEVELSRRLPDIAFTILDEGPSRGLARDDFGRIRTVVEQEAPDLIIWQVGTGDALAATDPEAFDRTLEQAADWLKGRDIDLVLIDPPYVPGVAHERAYGRIVKQIDAVSAREHMNVVQQYGATSFLSGVPGGQLCMPELIAEAIVRAATR